MKEYALKCHSETNHLYDGKPFEVHLQMVVGVANRFKHLIPPDKWEVVESACWCHDVIEDTRQTYNDVKSATNQEIAEIVYALTNEKGRNRKERANDRYYDGIRDTPYARFVKICDRIANVEYSMLTGSRMYEMYKKENMGFYDQLYSPEYEEMFDYLVSL